MFGRVFLVALFACRPSRPTSGPAVAKVKVMGAMPEGSSLAELVFCRPHDPPVDLDIVTESTEQGSRFT